MKKSILLFVLTCCYSLGKLLAQSGSGLDLQGEIQNSLSTLNKSRISTGILYDRVIPYGTVRDFDGVNSGDQTILDWDQNYSELKNAALNDSGWMDLDSIIFKRNLYLKNGIIPVLFAAYKYNSVKDSAVEFDYLDTLNGFFYDNYNSQTEPYNNNTYFSACAAMTNIGSDKKATFLISRDFYFTNYASMPFSIEIDFGDGNGFVAVAFGNTYTIDYSTSSSFEHKITIKVKNYVVSKVEIVNTYFKGRSYEQINNFPFVNAEYVIDDLEASKSYKGLKAHARIDVLFGKASNGKVKNYISKPLIMVEGIDFAYPNSPTYRDEYKCGQLGFTVFKTGKNVNSQTAVIENELDFEKAPQMLKQLQDLGYDVLYVDFHDGADYMQRNAMVIVELIQRLNSNTLSGVVVTSDIENVVLGASMGGQLAKYALSYMEKNKICHKTRLYTSFDSPHKGANIPVSIQAFIRLTAKNGLTITKEKVNRILNRPATKQLLMQYYNLENDFIGENDLRYEFMSDLANLGTYPKFTKNIAIANGSGHTTLFDFNSGDKLAYGDYNNALFKLSYNLWATKGVKSSGRNNVIYQSNVLKNQKIVAVSSSSLAYDHIPGAARGDLQDLKINKKLNILEDKTCFIPTISSLDVNTSDFLYSFGNLAPYDQPNSMHPFDAIYFQSENQNHVKITLNGVNGSGTGNADWFIRELIANEYKLPATLTSNFNLGNNVRNTIKSIEVQSGASLSINKFAKVLYGAASDPLTTAGSTYIAKTDQCNPLIVINSNASLVIGDANAPNSNKAVLYLKTGSTLELKSNSTLKINNLSALIIEKGATLIYHPGAKIILEGKDAVLEIKGKILLKNNADFTFSKGNSTEGGHLRFQAQSWNNGDARIEVENNATATMTLIGAHNDDLLMEIDGYLVVPGPNSFPTRNVSSFIINYGKITYGAYSSLNVESQFSAFETKFVAMPSNVKGNNTGLALFGQPFVFIDKCKFENLNEGVVNYATPIGPLFTVKSTSFKNCNTGVRVLNSGTVIDNCSFTLNDIGLLIDNALQNSKIINGTNISMNNIGMRIISSPTASQNIYVEKSNLHRNQIAVDNYNSALVFKCTVFGENMNAINSNDGIINLSRNLILVNNAVGSTVFGSDNTFVNNSVSINLFRAELYLENGANNFISATAPQNFILGTLPYRFGVTYLNFTTFPVSLKANGNFWNPAPANLLTAGPNYFNIAGDNGGSFLIPLAVSGGKRAAVNTLCYNPKSTGCTTCEMVINGSNNVNESINEISVYPNPVSVGNDFEINLNQLYDESNLNQTISLKIVNLEGKLIYQSNEISSTYRVNTSEWSAGIYFIQLDVNGERKTLKMIVQ